MARNRSFIKNLSVEKAIKSHDCHHDKTHRLSSGETRLKLKQNRRNYFFCVKCATKSIEIDILKLSKIKEELLK